MILPVGTVVRYSHSALLTARDYWQGCGREPQKSRYMEAYHKKVAMRGVIRLAYHNGHAWGYKIEWSCNPVRDFALLYQCMTHMVEEAPAEEQTSSMRNRMWEEIRQIEHGMDSGSPERLRRIEYLVKELNRVLCRECSKEYDANKSRAESGYCSMKCQHTMAKRCGFKKTIKGKPEYNFLNAKGQVGNKYVVS